MDSYVAASGRGAPAGGISPLGSLRMTFSHCAGLEPGVAASAGFSEKPAAFTLAWWQVAQYRLRPRIVDEAPGRSAAAGVDNRMPNAAPVNMDLLQYRISGA